MELTCIDYILAGIALAANLACLVHVLIRR